MSHPAPIGIFDSGYGGLTVLDDIKKHLPAYDFIYLGDNARTPYGSRSFETVYAYTLECVTWLFQQGCELVILACNTASAKALRSIQQIDLPKNFPGKRVLGVIRPSAEVIADYSITKHIGVLGTKGTVKSGSYLIEINKFSPDSKIFQHACPMWVPLVENNEYKGQGADYFVKKDIEALLNLSPQIDTLLLACTHYPLLIQKIKEMLPQSVRVVSQGPIVADSLVDYLSRHPEIDQQCSKQGTLQFYTTDDVDDFDAHSEIFFGKKINSIHLNLGNT